MRIINTQKKLCNRVFADQADLPLLYDAFKNNFQLFNKLLKMKTHLSSKNGAFPAPGRVWEGISEICFFVGKGVILFFFINTQ